MASGNRKITDIFLPKSKNNSKQIATSSTNAITSAQAKPTESSSSQSLLDVSSQVNQLELSGEIPFRPPKSFVFPKTKVGDRNRSCQHQWFEKFPWLHYDSTLVFLYKSL